ncbi:MAG: SDR family oxidoreductase [Kordiimonadaceae bacterium]|nr:SDR family oxidoreductase [Kordiimonadaceae bacterium]MBO6569132.1 SDR family oxidoreductase [Kordiimonadaceae bacterium]MBO6964607.1 SDR family oxidoreductase [Kordiimonadaceae bacterium]
MSSSHKFRAALVTGGGVRIGRSICLELARLGIAVAVHHRDSDAEARELVKEIKQAGGHACSVQADLSDTPQVEDLVEVASDALGLPIDVLVNNASVFEKDTLQTMTKQSWNIHQAVNLHAPILLTQKMAAALSEDQKGCVINLIDQRVLKLNPQYFSYTASKAGLWTVTRTMAQSLAPSIRVNAISPGPTLGNQFQAAADFEAESSSVMLQSGPQLEEITAALAFLLETPSITGQMITLDGGQHLAWQTPDILED